MLESRLSLTANSRSQGSEGIVLHLNLLLVLLLLLMHLDLQVALALHDAVELGLDVKLGMLCLDALQLDGDFFQR